MTSPRLRRPATVMAAVGLTSFAVFSGVPAGAAGDDGVSVVNTETVKIYMTANGKVTSKRVYEQLGLTGNGKVEIRNPVSTDGLRNLDGFAGFDVKDGDQIVNTTVDGRKDLRSVSNFTGKVPLTVEVTYELDGNRIAPADLVGKSGRLKVQFRVTNVTAKEQQVEVPDGEGGTVTRTAEVALPIVGSVSTTAPSSFANVASDEANKAGDGQGGTTLSFTMTLLPPIGDTSTTFGYTANVKDAVVPRIEITALPVDPLKNPTFASAAKSYQSGADTGAELAAGAAQIDSNLLKLRDGAGDLLSGIIRLSDGADELSSGLNNTAVPGSKRLADGAGRLDDGTSEALAGGKKLSNGLSQISGGLGQLADELPAAKPGIEKLQSGLAQILAGFGAAGQTGTLIDGLTQMQAGAQSLSGGLTQLRGNASGGLTQAKGGVDQVQAGLEDAVEAGGSLDQLIGGLGSLAGNATGNCPTTSGPVPCAALAGNLRTGAEASKTSLTTANGALQQISAGLGTAIGALTTQLIPGADQLAVGAGTAKGGAQTLKAGTQQVKDGLTTLQTKLAEAIAGVLKLDSGASQAYDGSKDLVGGLGRLDNGAGELSAGTDRLADGLGTAADGSKQLADGLGQARAAAPALPDGAQRLSEEGTSKLVAAGQDTAVNYGEMVAVLDAGAERAQAESMAIGAPEGALGLTAYSFTITEENGATGRKITRTVAALALLAAAGGLIALRRRKA